MLPHNTRCVVAPPGELPRASGEGVIILVPTLMRSGTHLLIDLILNNFKQFKKKPLYVDLDQWISKGGKIDDLKNRGDLIIKTHFPQEPSLLLKSEMKTFIETNNVKVITTHREESKLIRSLKESFSVGEKQTILIENIAQFNEFWNQSNRRIVDFNDLCSKEKVSQTIDLVSSYIGYKPNTMSIPNPSVTERKKVFVMKFATRIFGKNAPIINTTIGFAKNKK